MSDDQNPKFRDVLTRMRKIEGQARGISRMMEEERYCVDILQQILALELGKAKTETEEAEAAAAVAEEAARKAAEDAEREAHRQRMEQLAIFHAAHMSGHSEMTEKQREDAKRLEEERLEREAKAKAEAEEMLKKRLQMEEEIAEARSEAEAAVRGATATFSTAGGTFVAATNAQVNEAKLLRNVSEKSRELLAQIVENTKQMMGISLA